MDLDPHFGLALSARLPLRIQTCAENGPQTAIGGLTRMLSSERFFFEDCPATSVDWNSELQG